jgi:hypothetical protein
MSTVESTSGILRLAGPDLVYVVSGQEAWRVAVADVRLVAEYTNEDGPDLDDYFYVFAAGRPCLFYEAPMYAGAEVVEEIGKMLGVVLHAGLCNSTTFKSRVMWPPALANHPYFEYTVVRRGPGLWSRIKDRVLPLIQSDLTDEVEAYLRDGAD